MRPYPILFSSRFCQIGVMPSPLPLRAPPPPPENGGESDSEPSVKKQKINEELTTLDGEGEGKIDSDDSESSRFGTLDPLTVSPGPSEGCKSYTIDNIHEYDMLKELYTPLYPGDILGDEACWNRYFQQCTESEGFDIKDFPGYGPMTTIHPIRPTEEIKGFAAQALELYNEDYGTKYEEDEVLKVNRSCGQYFSYYITFTVTNGNDEKIYFQAQVDQDVDQSLECVIIRPREKGGSDI